MNRKILLAFSLAPILLMGEASTATTNPFENLKMSGEVKYFHYTIDKESGEDPYANAIGGHINLETDKSKSFYAKVGFYTSQPFGGGRKIDKTYLFDGEDGITANSEAYIAWHNDIITIRGGNLMLNTPMMRNDSTRIVPYSYQGVALDAKINEDLKLELYQIQNIRNKNSTEFTSMSPSGDIGQGISAIGLKYNGIENTKLKTYYYYVPDLYSTFTAEAAYNYKLDEDSSMQFVAQYFNSGNAGKNFNPNDSKKTKAGGDDINLYALRVGYKYKAFNTNLNYSRNFGESGVVNGYGGLASVLTTSMIANGRGDKKPETWMWKNIYTLSATDWGTTQLALTLTNTNFHEESGNDFNAVYAHIKQKFTKADMLYLRYENLDRDKAGTDTQYFRAIYTHKF